MFSDSFVLCSAPSEGAGYPTTAEKKEKDDKKQEMSELSAIFYCS